MILIMASIGIITTGSQTVLAGFLPPTADLDIDEDELAGNTTNMTMMDAETNQTTIGNMTGMMNDSTG